MGYVGGGPPPEKFANIGTKSSLLENFMSSWACI